MNASRRRIRMRDAGACLFGLIGLSLPGLSSPALGAAAQPMMSVPGEHTTPPSTVSSATPPATATSATSATPATAGRALLRGDETADLTELPSNITVLTFHRELVARMLQMSPTFKRQCARIGKAVRTLSVELREAPAGSTSGARAQTFINHRRDGTAQAQVFLSTDQRAASVELIAHEFEHILEFLDGVDYGRGERSGQVRGSISGALETRRAIAVGHQVAREVRDDHGGREVAAAGTGPM